MKINCGFFSKGVDKLMEDLLKCASRACYSFALLYEYVGCFALLEGGRCFGCAKSALHWDFLPSGAFFWRFLYILEGAWSLAKKLKPNKYLWKRSKK